MCLVIFEPNGGVAGKANNGPDLPVHGCLTKNELFLKKCYRDPRNKGVAG